MSTVDYTVTKLFDNKELTELCYEKNADNVYLMAAQCEQSLKYHKSIPSGVTLFKNILKHDQFKTEYCDYIMGDIVEYYINNYDEEELDDYLRHVDVSRLKREIRNKVIELMIMRGLYAEAAIVLKKYGICELSSRRILKFCSQIIKENEDIEKENLLEYCAYSFRHGKYNDNVLEYLVNYFNGALREMMELWRVSKEYENDTRELEERIITQMLFARTHLGSITTIYESYYKKGALPILKQAYFFFLSYEYFVKEKPVDEMFFLHLKNEMNFNDNLMNVCKCAFLKYCTEKIDLSDKAITICRYNIKFLEKEKILFNFYKKFSKYFPLSGNIMNKTIIEYRTEPGEKVQISYAFEDKSGLNDFGNNNYMTEEMEQQFAGLYTKSFVVFYGEKIQYYITESSGEHKKYTQSANYTLDDRAVDVSTTRFGIINDILECMEIKEESVIQELTKKYYITKSLTEQLFG